MPNPSVEARPNGKINRLTSNVRRHAHRAHMSLSKHLLPELRQVAEEQKQLLLLALALGSGSTVEHRGVQLSYQLGDLQRRTSTVLAMAAGQSIETLISNSDLRGLPVRDMYPVARSAVETFINASFLLAEDEAVSQRALDHVPFAYWRHLHRRVGAGKYTLEMRSQHMHAGDAKHLFPQFAGKGKPSTWTSLDVPSRIDRVGKLAGDHVAARLLVAYAMTFSLSSEIVHGSLFGASYFFGLHLKNAADVESFRAKTEEQIEDILIAVLHARAGFLAAFFGLQAHDLAVDDEAALFKRLQEIASSDGDPDRINFVFAVSKTDRHQ